MVNLLKTDFKRVLKDKLFLVLCILGVVFAIITPVLHRVILSAAGEVAEELFADLTYAKTHFFTAFSLSDNLGLIAPILLSIVLCKDFSFGTVRNKIISGKRRADIFLSLFTVCFTVLWLIILFHAFINLSVSLIFFDFQQGDFTASSFFYTLASIGFQMLVYLNVAAIISWLCACSKNVGIAIVLYFALSFGFTLISGILAVGNIALTVNDGNQFALDVIDFFQRINIFYSCSTIGKGTEYELKDILYHVIPPIIGTGAFLGLGILKFNKKDLK